MTKILQKYSNFSFYNTVYRFSALSPLSTPSHKAINPNPHMLSVE